MKIKLIVDSTFNLSEEYILENNISVIPLNVVIDGKTYLDGIEITLEEVMAALDNNKKVSTSQPTPFVFAENFNKAKEDGYTDIICMTISSTLSGTFQAANIGAESIDGINIHLIDTLSASLGAEMLARIVVECLNNKMAIDEIIFKINKIKDNAGLVFTMENLTALRKSGRIGRVKATLGNLLRVKPMIEYFNGEVSINSKFRTDSQVMEWIVSRMKSTLDNVTSKIHIIVAHINAEVRVNKLIEFISNAFPNIKVIVNNAITPVIAINVGYGGLGASWCYE